jgi:hypothetical protein
MPFVGNMVSREPFLRRVSQHPNKALFNLGSPNTTMSTRYHDTLLDHLTDFMIYLFSLSVSVVVIIVVGMAIVASAIVPIAVVVLVFVLCCPLVLLLHRLVVA